MIQIRFDHSHVECTYGLANMEIFQQCEFMRNIGIKVVSVGSHSPSSNISQILSN